jgi:hypothetical protein
VLTQVKGYIGPSITQSVVATMMLVDDSAALTAEIGALCQYIEHLCHNREATKRRKQWDEDRAAKISDAILTAMREWDDEHYPRLLEATWGWHPFYVSFVSNPLSIQFRPSYPLHHSVVEGSNVHALLVQHPSVQRVYPVPWSVLLLRCFLKFHSLPHLISDPHSGGTDANVREWLSLAEDTDGSGSRSWHLAVTYLKGEGFLMFAGARPVDSQEQWVAEVEDAWSHLKNPTVSWWIELRGWCNSIQIRAIQDMAFHDKQAWLNAWVIRDRPTTPSPHLACYLQWLRHREDLDIGYILAKPGEQTHLLLVTCWLPLNTHSHSLIHTPNSCVFVVADVMVPSLERAEYLEDLRNLADNIVRDRLEHSDVHPLAHGMPSTPASPARSRSHILKPQLTEALRRMQLVQRM